MKSTQCFKNIPRWAFFLIFMKMDLSFWSRLKNLGSYILPYGKWHCLLDLLFYLVKLCLSKLAVVHSDVACTGASGVWAAGERWTILGAKHLRNICVFLYKNVPCWFQIKCIFLVHAWLNYLGSWFQNDCIIFTSAVFQVAHFISILYAKYKRKGRNRQKSCYC